MTTNDALTAEAIIELCSKPIACIKQVAWKYDDSTTTGKMKLWGGRAPIIAICFEDGNDSCLFVGATDTALAFRLTNSDDYDAVLSLENQIEEEDDYDRDELIGVFDLDSVVCPVSEWVNLGITKASVITTVKDNTVVGLCLGINLGIRLGLFVAPFPGITLSFNDTCDSILRQAEKAQQAGLVQIVSKEFTKKETPKPIDTIDWFDWLRRKI